jgi:hypothetical protein
LLIQQPKICLVRQFGASQRVVGTLGLQVLVGNTPKLIVNQR